MKIFGSSIVEISKKQGTQSTPIHDLIAPELQQVPIPGKKVNTAELAEVGSPVYLYPTERSFGRGVFRESEYDLSEIGRVSDTDSYASQAFLKKIGHLMKEGWDIVGPNKRTVKYVKTRLDQVAHTSGISTDELIRRLSSSLIKQSNAFLIKVRKTEASGGRLRTTLKGKKLKPVAGYFPAPSETMQVDLDEKGKIRQWRQIVPNSLRIPTFPPSDVVHFHFDRKEGFAFGTPTLTPVIDDIRALRKIEENVELLVYQHMFPLFQYKVGTDDHPAGLMENGEREIDVVRREIQFMPSEGGIVTPGRHEIRAIGSEGRALRAEGYLEHFQKRVWAGLGVSGIDMGDSDTSNRATSESLSQALKDSVKDFQKVVECAFNELIINELLEESAFGTSVLNQENRVFLKFNEIDIDKRIKVENHAADLFAKNAITWDELRQRIGSEPIFVPMFAEDDSPEEFPEWHNTSWKLFEDPSTIIKAVDELYKPLTRAALRNRSLDVGAEDLESAISSPSALGGGGGKQPDPDLESKNTQELEIQKRQHAHEVTLEKMKPKPAPKPAAQPVAKKVKDNLLLSRYLDLESDASVAVTDPLFNMDYLAQIARANATSMVDDLLSHMMSSFTSGMMEVTDDINILRQVTLKGREILSRRANTYVTRLIDQVIDSIRRNVDTLDVADKISLVHSVFSSFKYRTDFISDVEVRKARNLGTAVALQQLNFDKINIRSGNVDVEGICNKCKSHDSIDLSSFNLDMIPPFHAACQCQLAEATKVEPTEDSHTVLDKTREQWSATRIFNSLKRRHPTWGADRLTATAHAIRDARNNK